MHNVSYIKSSRISSETTARWKVVELSSTISLSHSVINNRHRLQIDPLSPNAKVTISSRNRPCLSQQYNGPCTIVGVGVCVCLQWMSHIGDVCLLACVTYCTKFMVKERSPCKRCKCASVLKVDKQCSLDLNLIYLRWECVVVCVCVCVPLLWLMEQLCQLYCPLSNSWWTRWCPQCILSPWPLATGAWQSVWVCVCVWKRENQGDKYKASKWI